MSSVTRLADLGKCSRDGKSCALEGRTYQECREPLGENVIWGVIIIKLKEFKAQNFRSLHQTDWIKVFDITAFIGENDGGKTACTDAIRLLFDRNGKPEEGDFTWENAEDEHNHRRSQIINLEAKLEVKDDELERIIEIVGQEIRELHIKKLFNIDGSSSFTLIGQVPEIEDFQENWQSKTVQELKDLANVHGIDLTGVTNKAPIIQRIQEWVNTKPTIEGEKALPGQLLPLLPRVELFSSSKALNPEEVVNNVLKLLCKNEISSGRYQGQIAEIETGITETLRQKVAELTPHIRKYYDEVEGVNIDPVFNISSGLAQVPLKLFKQGGGPIELQKKGDGKKRQVALGIYEWSTEALNNQEIQDDIVLIMDEPDTHMDYHSQRKLFDIISTYVNNSMQVIICTHSLNLINRMPVNKINHYYLDPNSHTKIESLSVEDEETETLFINEIGLTLGLDTGTMFHERCFLVVEGPTEIHALPQLFRTIHGKSMQSSGIKIVNGENNGGARNFAKFLNSNGRNVIFLLDTDCTTGPQCRVFTPDNLTRDGFDITNQVYFIGTAELEDAFSDNVYVILANSCFPREDGSPWQTAEFANLRLEGKFSDNLQALLRQSKPHIGYKLGEVIYRVDDIPQVIIDCLVKANELANTLRL